MTTVLVVWAVLVHGLVAGGALARRWGRPDPLQADRDRDRLRRALEATERTGATAPR